MEKRAFGTISTIPIAIGMLVFGIDPQQLSAQSPGNDPERVACRQVLSDFVSRNYRRIPMTR
jgi:hypothetical protein